MLISKRFNKNKYNKIQIHHLFILIHLQDKNNHQKMILMMIMLMI